ncbi:MAG: hypothetical protein RL038_265, partial [Actinomycetota bacterium]
KGAIVEYESADLVNWKLVGQLANIETGLPEPSPQSTVWECPQLVELDGHWILLVSAMDATGHIGVRYAVGNYDGKKFEPTYWGDFSNSGEIYATSLFYDRDGKPGLISWLKEINDTPPAGSSWTGAQSVPAHISLVNHRLRVTPLESMSFPDLSDHQSVTSTWTGRVVGDTWNLEVEGSNTWKISCEYGLLTVTSHNPKIIHVGASKDFRILVDTDICEIYTDAGEGAITFRCPVNQNAELKLS